MQSDKPAIAAAVIVADGKLFLVRRRQAEGSLLWSFPSGQVEPTDRSVFDTAVRETFEETGLVIGADVALGDRVHPNTKRHMFYIAAHVIAGDARVADEDELDAVAWVTLDEIRDYVPYPFFEPVEEHLAAVMA